MGGGNFVSTSQRTTVVNGKKTIIKETRDGQGNTTVEKTTIEPDGRRTQETIVNGKQQSLITDNAHGSSGDRLKIEDHHYNSGRDHHHHDHSERRGSMGHSHSSANPTSASTATATGTTDSSSSPKDKSKKKFGFHRFF